MSHEIKAKSLNGWVILPVLLIGYLASVYCIVGAIIELIQTEHLGSPVMLTAGVVILVATIFVNNGLFSLQPGQARVCVLFGSYIGTIRSDGLHFVNPLCAHELSYASEDIAAGSANTNGETSTLAEVRATKNRSVISVRARTLTGDKLKVNDKMGNPIEIATVIVWRVEDTAKAVFDVDNYEKYVRMQAETALRHVASLYAYDHMEDDDDSNTAITLRSNIEEVSNKLKEELSRKFEPAGVCVEDARLTHLAYAPEIAQAMLRRQQAEAVISARKKIVEGAVSMVDMALEQLDERNIVEFDNERKAAMASNLMVVLCGDSETQPVINTGSLYQ